MSPSRPTVLCVGKGCGLLDEMTRALLDSGCAVVGTTSAERALQLAHSRPVDGVLIDLFLRKCEPTALRDEIRRTLPGIPILLFHGEGQLIGLEVQVMMAWIHRARSEAGPAGKDAFAAALEEYTTGAREKNAGARVAR